MTVQINEPGRHHEAGDVEVRVGAGQGVPDLGDRAAGDRDILHRVQARFGIDHAPAAQHDVRLAHGRLLCHGPEDQRRRGARELGNSGARQAAQQ